jgi:hypothetical protein
VSLNLEWLLTISPLLWSAIVGSFDLKGVMGLQMEVRAPVLCL